MKGYVLQENGTVTSAMEDYLEMIARLSRKTPTIRVSDLSEMLHVKASSVTKMVQQLAQGGFITAKRYGDIALTEAGKSRGAYLLYRHDVIERFLRLINQSDNELEQTEKIEHFLDERTVRRMELLNESLLLSAPQADPPSAHKDPDDLQKGDAIRSS